jgi:hypothetical protein
VSSAVGSIQSAAVSVAEDVLEPLTSESPAASNATQKEPSEGTPWPFTPIALVGDSFFSLPAEDR